jgi:hypothetical protein
VRLALVEARKVRVFRVYILRWAQGQLPRRFSGAEVGLFYSETKPCAIYCIVPTTSTFVGHDSPIIKIR